jgi:hypothetical protein
MLLTLMAGVAFLSSLGIAQITGQKLSKQEMIGLLTRDVPSGQVAAQARKSGISLHVTPEPEMDIRAAGINTAAFSMHSRPPMLC